MADQPDYAETIEAQMLADYVSGGMPLAEAMRTLGVGKTITYERIKNSARFAEMMELARDLGADQIACDIRHTARGAEGYSSGDVKRDKLIVETDLKLLAKWHPKKYGEKLEIEQKTASIAIPVGDDPIAAQRAYEELMKGS